jgi:hypothetical protein
MVSYGKCLNLKVRQDIRYLLSPQIEKKTFSGVINALIIGDRSLIPDAQWSLEYQYQCHTIELPNIMMTPKNN